MAGFIGTTTGGARMGLSIRRGRNPDPSLRGNRRLQARFPRNADLGSVLPGNRSPAGQTNLPSARSSASGTEAPPACSAFLSSGAKCPGYTDPRHARLGSM
jgi:hypothetical protein